MVVEIVFNRIGLLIIAFCRLH